MPYIYSILLQPYIALKYATDTLNSHDNEMYEMWFSRKCVNLKLLKLHPLTKYTNTSKTTFHVVLICSFFAFRLIIANIMNVS